MSQVEVQLKNASQAKVYVCVCVGVRVHVCVRVWVCGCVCVTDGRTGLNTTLTFLTESHSTQYITSHEGITEDPLELKIN